MSHLVELDLGQPRILRASRGATRVRIYGCRSCTQDPTAATGCRHEQDRIAKVFSGLYQRDIAVREISCCRRGHGACDFEVRHG